MKEYDEKDKLIKIEDEIIKCYKKIHESSEYDEQLYKDANFYLACYKYLDENIKMKQKEYNGEIPTIKIKRI